MGKVQVGKLSKIIIKTPRILLKNTVGIEKNEIKMYFYEDFKYLPIFHGIHLIFS